MLNWFNCNINNINIGIFSQTLHLTSCCPHAKTQIKAYFFWTKPKQDVWWPLLAASPDEFQQSNQNPISTWHEHVRCILTKNLIAFHLLRNFNTTPPLFLYHDHPAPNWYTPPPPSRNYIRVFKSEKFRSILFVKYANSAFSYLAYNFPLFRNEAKSFLNILSQTQNIVRAIWVHTFLEGIVPKIYKKKPS